MAAGLKGDEMYYSRSAPAGQSGAQEKLDRDIDHDLVAIIADLPTHFPPIDTPIEVTIGIGNFATTPLPGPKLEAMEAKSLTACRPGASVTGTTPPTAPHQSHPYATTSNPLRTRTTTNTKGTSKPRWRDLGDLHKLQASVESAGRLRGSAWSLNFGIGREGALLASQDPARLLSNDISRELRRAIGRDLPYSFVLELERDDQGFDRLHAHGVIVLSDADKDRVREALVRAGGKIEDSVWADRQLDMRAVTDASGWTAYITKMRRWGKATPAGRHSFISRRLKAIARQDYAEHGLSRPISFSKPRRK